MALQSVVEKLHHNQRQELNALCAIVTKSWEELDAMKLTNVYERWKMVLDLFLKDDEGDIFMEANLGKLFRAPSRKAEDLDEDQRKLAAEVDQLTGEDIDDMDLGLD